MRERLQSQDGVALITAMIAILLISVMTALILTLSIRQERQSSEQRREDTVIAGTEALLDRYAAKLTLDSQFYLHWVDEAERARLCTDAESPSNGLVTEPGTAWDDTCLTWTYQNPDRDGDGNPDADPDWWVHPLLEGTNVDLATVDRDDISVQLEVAPPSANAALTVTVAGKSGERVNRRVIQAAITATSLSEFFRVTENNLSFGPGAEVFGKIYSGGELEFDCCPKGKVHDDIYAEINIAKDPEFLDGSQGYHGSQNPPHGDIRDVFPEPLDFDNFWDDLETIQASACAGGICLEEAGVNAWLVHPFVSGGKGKLEVWKSTDNRSLSCVNSEEYWWLYSHDPSGSDTFNDLWDPHGTFDMPSNGALWADGHLVVGHHGWAAGKDVDGDGYADAIAKGNLTMYAGTSSNPKNVIINADTFYEGQDPSTLDIPNDYVLGLIASDEVVINPNAVHADRKLYINASLLGQTDRWLVATSCGETGSRVTPSSSSLYVTGSIATKNTGKIAGSFDTRYYYFDDRLAYLRPPFYPLLGSDWRYEDWKELPLPAWAVP